MNTDARRLPQPLYSSADLHPAFQLRYGWSAWPSQSSFPALPTGAAWEELIAGWERDGLRVLETDCTDAVVQITFSATPSVSPVLLATRAKGRLEHAWRAGMGQGVRFSRKVAVRSIGDMRREAAERYIANQVSQDQFVDPGFERFLKALIIEDASVDLSLPSETQSGRYWYNLHVVLVVAQRFRIADRQRLSTIRDCCLAVARKKGHLISRLAVMPDHLHMATRPELAHSPEEVALGLLNNLSYALGQQRWWSGNWYAGTFGEYSMGAIR